MKVFVLVFVALLGFVAAQSPTGPLRFLVTPKTITSTVTVAKTETAFKGITTSCFATTAALSPCRRRRNIMEIPLILEADDGDDEIDPSEPIEIIVTAYPEARSLVRAGPIADSAPMDVQPSIESTAGMAEVQIRDLDAVCKSRAANPFFGVGLAQVFGITVLFSTTVTATTTTTSTSTTVAATNRFTIGNCLPSPFPFDACKV